VRGPVSPSTNYECGLLVDGFDSPPVLMMSFNPPYYATLLEQLGLTKARDLYAYWIDANPHVPEKVRRVAERARRQFGVTVRQANLRDFKAESARIRQVYNEAWQPNWGFVPLAQDEFDFLAESFRPILLPEFILLAEVDGKPVGFVLGLPDMNRVLARLNGRLFPFGFLKLLRARRRIRQLRVPILGVMPAYQNRGVGALFYLELMEQVCALGYEGGEVSWVLEDNAMANRAAAIFGGRRYKTYRIYEGPVARGG
jgi:GNAT superfamily N-acetyltransferase